MPSHKGHLSGPRNPMYGTHRRGADAPHYGMPHSEASKEKNRQSNRGQQRSLTTRQRMSQRRSGAGNPQYGKPLSASHNDALQAGRQRHWATNGHPRQQATPSMIEAIRQGARDGKSRQQMAEETGLSYQYVCKIVRGQVRRDDLL